MNQLRILIASALIAISVNSNAQEKDTKQASNTKLFSKGYAVTVGLARTNDFPLFDAISTKNKVKTDYNPNVLLGVSNTFRVGKKSRQLWHATLNRHSLYYYEKSFGLQLGVTNDWQVYKRFFAGVSLNAGIAFAKRADVIYVLENGLWQAQEYPSKYNTRRTTVMSEIHIGYALPKVNMEILINSNMQANLPAFKELLPLSVHRTPIGLTLRKYINK
jgi:hypothetical protein